jgi:hypothetical protein
MFKKSLPIYCLTLLLLVFIPNGLTAQNSKKGYKLLEKADYEKSREVFRGILEENRQDPAALFGMSLILANDQSPYFDLIGAWEHARQVTKYMDNLTPEEIEIIGEYFLNTEVRHISRPVKKKMEYAIETIEAKLIKYVREENNLDIVYQVIEKFPDFRHYDNVVHIRNQLEFRKYEKQNQLEGYLEFMQKFPDAAQYDKALKYRNKLTFEKVCQTNTVEAYRDFIHLYPQAAEVTLATKKLHAVAFEQAKQKNTIAAFDEFMVKYPDALEISEARIIQRQLLYEYAKKIHTLEAYNEFIRKYPEGQQYIDIFNLKAMDNGRRFMERYPLPSGKVQWTRSFDEESNQELSACFTLDTMNNYVLGGTVYRTDTGSTDAWIIKLDQNGKMIWNKYTGEGHNDEVNLLAINPRNEILGAGNTWMGTDSSSLEAWLFKLGPEGQKLWSKKLGKMHIKTMLVSKDGTTFLGGYLVDDSLRRKYSIITLNANGKRLWSRTYTGTGEILKLWECPDQRILIAGNHWHAKIHPKGYLVWESAFKSTDSIMAALVISKGDICYMGTRNQKKLVFLRTGPDNKPLMEKVYDLPDPPAAVTGLIQASPNQLIALFSYAEYQTLNWINPVNGEIVNTIKLSDGSRIQEIKTDRNNNLLLAACNGEIILICNSGTAF